MANSVPQGNGKTESKKCQFHGCSVGLIIIGILVIVICSAIFIFQINEINPLINSVCLTILSGVGVICLTVILLVCCRQTANIKNIEMEMEKNRKEYEYQIEELKNKNKEKDHDTKEQNKISKCCICPCCCNCHNKKRLNDCPDGNDGACTITQINVQN